MRYGAGELTVRGVTYLLAVDDNGTWHASDTSGRETSGATRDEVKTRLERATREAATKVAVPFAALDWPMSGITGPQIRQGTATGIHTGTGNVLVQWADGRREQLKRPGTVLRGLDDAEVAAWAMLATALAQARRELAAFENPRRIISLAQAVREAIAAEVDQQEAGRE